MRRSLLFLRNKERRIPVPPEREIPRRRQGFSSCVLTGGML